MDDNTMYCRVWLTIAIGAVLTAAAIAIPCSVAYYHVRSSAFKEGYEQRTLPGSNQFGWVKAEDKDSGY